MSSYVQPNSYIAIRLPSGSVKVIKIVPNTNFSIPKLGSFPANLLIGRPFNLTYELLDRKVNQPFSRLRIVSAEELNSAILYQRDERENDTPNTAETAATAPDNNNTDVNNDADISEREEVVRTNRFTVDDSSRQRLDMCDIEALKRTVTGSGKEIVEKIIQSHAGIDEKTELSREKYTLRKSKKYLKIFSVLPVDTGVLIRYFLERDPGKILELREETLSLMMCMANVKWMPEIPLPKLSDNDGTGMTYCGRWLVVDETGGLIIAAMAERLNILYTDCNDDTDVEDEEYMREKGNTDDTSSQLRIRRGKPSGKARLHRTAMSANSNTITLLHANTQPNLGLIQYFGFNPSCPDTSHPLYTNLRCVSWLQLLEPEKDSFYGEPEKVTDEVLSSMKSGKRVTYFRKRRRWERVKRVVDETRQGEFDGLVVGSTMNLVSVLKATIGLLKSGSQVVVYSATIEPLTILMDLYSKERKAEYNRRYSQDEESEDGGTKNVSMEDFPLDPSALLTPSLQSVRARPWQILPGRTHPMMACRGGAEGYIFTATKVIPFDGRVEARGAYSKKRRAA